MAGSDPRSDDELRRCIGQGEPPERVHAAFELGRRLGAAVTGELSLCSEPTSGVRRHWLTMLASFGERDAVRSVAEQHAGDEEGEHALHLALQLDLGDPRWWAERFGAATSRMQGVLLERAPDRVDWTATVPALERLLRSDFAETRAHAARRLLVLDVHPGPALREYALAHLHEAAEVLNAWARGPDHRTLVDALPLGSGRSDAGVEALLAAGRTYELADLRALVVAHPEAFVLVRSPAVRRELFEVTEAVLASARWPSDAWLAELAKTAGPPWNAAERRMLVRWAEESALWTDE